MDQANRLPSNHCRHVKIAALARLGVALCLFLLTLQEFGFVSIPALGMSVADRPSGVGLRPNVAPEAMLEEKDFPGC